MAARPGVPSFQEQAKPLKTDKVHKIERCEDFCRDNRCYTKYIKRVLDVSVAAVLLVLMLPVYVVIALCIVLETGRPVFYRAPRGGYHGKSFRIFKFRTMVQNADQIGGGTTALGDKRITKVGALLRKTKLDETPQLLNILKGQMSFIGPRPELLRYTSRYRGKEKCILSVRPGLTDYSSLKYIDLDEMVGSENADEAYEKLILKRKNELRMKYVVDVSFRVDFKLFVLTVCHVLKKFLRIFKPLDRRLKNGIHDTKKFSA